MKKKPRKTDNFVPQCEQFYEIFNRDYNASNYISIISNDPYFDRVANFLESSEALKPLAQDCLKCWDQVAAVAFTYGFAVGSMINPQNKDSLKVLQEMRKKMAKEGALPE